MPPAINALKMLIKSPAFLRSVKSVGYTGLLDGLVNDFKYDRESITPRRIGLDVFNLFGSSLGFKMLEGKKLGVGKAVTGASTLMALPIKDLAFVGASQLPNISKSLTSMAATDSSQVQNESKNLAWDKKKHILYAALGLGALGVGGVATGHAIKEYQEQKNNPQGKLKVILPTRDARDAETSIEMPITATGLSHAQLGNISRDIRRRIRRESKERIQHRIPRAGNPASQEQESE